MTKAHMTAFSSLIVILSAAVLAGPAVESQPEPSEAEQRFQDLAEKFLAGPQPDITSESWKQLTEDVGIDLFYDEHNRQRGTLYVRKADTWWPIALATVADLGPPIVPGRTH